MYFYRYKNLHHLNYLLSQHLTESQNYLVKVQWKNYYQSLESYDCNDSKNQGSQKCNFTEHFMKFILHVLFVYISTFLYFIDEDLVCLKNLYLNPEILRFQIFGYYQKFNLFFPLFNRDSFSYQFFSYSTKCHIYSFFVNCNS